MSVSETDPIHYFVVPSGKIRDATFIPDDKQTNIVIMSSQGYIYVEALNDASKQCVFYTMNVVSVQHPNSEESDQALVNGGGVSIYYSHTLKLLFFSYNKGCCFFSLYLNLTIFLMFMIKPKFVFINLFRAVFLWLFGQEFTLLYKTFSY